MTRKKDKAIIKRTKYACLVHLALNNELAMTSGNQFQEHFGKVLGHLLESSLNGLVLALIQRLDQFANGCVRGIQLLFALVQRVPLLGEAAVLLKGLLVDVTVFLQLLVHLVDLLQKL